MKTEVKTTVGIGPRATFSKKITAPGEKDPQKGLFLFLLDEEEKPMG